MPFSRETLFWLVVLGGFVAMVFFSMVILLKANYKRCSSNQVLVIFGKTAKGQAAKTVHGGAAFVVAAVSGLQLPEPGADPDRNSAPRRAVDARTSASTCPACSPWPSARSPT